MAAMAGTSRAAFAEVLDDHWKIFRDHLLEAKILGEKCYSEKLWNLYKKSGVVNMNYLFIILRIEIIFMI